jgi:hypothetical protein
MLGTYQYHEIIRKTMAAFGTLFNNVFIMHQDENSSDASLIKVPIAYGPVQKFLSRIEEKPDLRKRTAITLPRMSFEMTGLQYDASRKTSTMQSFKTNVSGSVKKVYMPVPYNIGIQLSIMSKYNDDMLQIIEQILPYFQPHFNLTINLISSIGEKKDIPIVLENINMDDQYEGDFSSRRILIYTLNFTAKVSIFGPVGDTEDKIIKKVQVDYHTNTDTSNYSRQLRYVVQPRAIKDYDNDQTAILQSDIDESVTKLEVSDAVSFSIGDYISINQELMYIKLIESNTLYVNRSQDGTSSAGHFAGDPINIITQQDNDLIQIEDDFAFDEERFDFGDGKVWSSKRLEDV